MNKKLLALTGAAAATITLSANAGGHNLVVADVNDPVSLRINVMQNVGAAAAVSGGMLKGEIPFDPVVAKGALAVLNTAALGMQGLFPAGSDSNPRSSAAPNVWTDTAGFNAAIAKFIADSGAANKSAPADLAAFGAAFGSVAANCKSCHQAYRVKN